MTDEEKVMEHKATVGTTTPPGFQPPAAVEYPKLPPRDFNSMRPMEYISERLNGQIAYYDKAAQKHKKMSTYFRVITVVGSALVPVLVNLDFPYVNILTTIISLTVVVLVSIESVLQNGAQWPLYRSTEQLLRKEYFSFTANEGQYADCEGEDAFRLFVKRVEDAIQAEVSTTLKVMTKGAASEKSGDDPVQIKDPKSFTERP